VRLLDINGADMSKVGGEFYHRLVADWESSLFLFPVIFLVSRESVREPKKTVAKKRANSPNRAEVGCESDS
jgi:hypothetical protein